MLRVLRRSSSSLGISLCRVHDRAEMITDRMFRTRYEKACQIRQHDTYNDTYNITITVYTMKQ